ncbi:MAG: hypothetical protein QOJ76_346 [Acidobacteriota bacterium]|jgi:hypothetical protein|nr:hypothetical protein [Acidobacteriota bacterium]
MNKTMNTSTHTSLAYETSDLMLASFLRCRNFNIEDIKRHSSRTIFVFEDSPQLRHAIIDYANDATVAVRSFCSTMRDLKAITR